MKYRSEKIAKLFNGDKTNNSTYIVSEVGINHNGSLKTALKLIEKSKDAGVDAVKFQKRNLNKIYTERILKDSNSAEWNFDYLIPILKEVELSKSDYRIIKKKCDRLGLDLIITPYDEDSADFANSLGVVAFKLSSSDMTNFSLVKKCSSFGVPLIVSTGMWTEKDIKDCAAFYRKNKVQYALLLANSTYPSPYESLNLKFLNNLKKYSPLVGYSGHERGIFIPVAAVAMGAKIIEKHITLHREDEVKVGNIIKKVVVKGPDHKASLLPSEFKEMVRDIRLLEKSMGDKKEVNEAEKLNKEAFAKSAVALKELKKGTVLREKDVIFRAPGKGLFPHQIENYFGRRVQRDIPKSAYISRSDFERELLVSHWKKFKFSQKWGVKCRFHDFNTYKEIGSPVIELHCSESDLNRVFRGRSETAELIVHAPEVMDRELVNICSGNEKTVKKSIKILQHTIDKTVNMSANFPKANPKLVIHFGGMLLNNIDNPPNEEMMKNAIRNFKRLKFDRKKIEILPENLPPRPWYLGGQWHQYGYGPAEDMVKFCEALKVGMTLDICHAALYCSYFNKDLGKYIRKVKKYVKHIHISDAKGIDEEGLQIGDGSVDFNSALSELKHMQFSWVPEIWRGHLYNGRGFYRALKKLEKYNDVL